MDWNERVPEGMSDVKVTDDGFTARVSIPLDEDGFFGRACPECETPFKMLHEQYEALPEDLDLTCPYCGHCTGHSDFITPAQLARVEAAAGSIAEQYVHDELGKMFGSVFNKSSRRRRSSGGLLSLEITYEPGSPPPIRALPEVIEQEVRRVIPCPACGNRYAVYGASSFCPVCGPRAATETVLEAIAAARASVNLEDTLPEDQREEMRAAGVFERFAVDAVKSTVSLFEVYAREQFGERCSKAAEITRGKGHVFQRLDDTARLFNDHVGLDLPGLVGPERWKQLQDSFARRHILVHQHGIVDQRFLDRTTNSGLRLGQRLIVTREQALQALDDLEAVVVAVSGA